MNHGKINRIILLLLCVVLNATANPFECRLDGVTPGTWNPDDALFSGLQREHLTSDNFVVCDQSDSLSDVEFVILDSLRFKIASPMPNSYRVTFHLDGLYEQVIVWSHGGRGDSLHVATLDRCSSNGDFCLEGSRFEWIRYDDIGLEIRTLGFADFDSAMPRGWNRSLKWPSTISPSLEVRPNWGDTLSGLLIFYGSIHAWNEEEPRGKFTYSLPVAVPYGKNEPTRIRSARPRARVVAKHGEGWIVRGKANEELRVYSLRGERIEARTVQMGRDKLLFVPARNSVFLVRGRDFVQKVIQ